MDNPKILLFDIETSHNVVAVFQLKQDYIQPSNILQERYIISIAWKWLGDKKVQSVSVLDNPELFQQDPHNDLYVLKVFHDILSEADIIVGHNSDKFDIKFVETRMLINGLPPLPPINKIDTLKVARKRFLFNSNKLDYLGHVLGVGRKIKTDNSLWLKILKGDPEAITYMVKYNKQDVELLERVFNKLKPYIPNLISREMFGKAGCPRCGSLKTQSRGVHRTLTKTYQRFQCLGCGGWFRQLKAENNPQIARTI